ncbi:helix-turn-helix domain-containing protein [Streptomyces sp. NBC_00989]|uniref:helix-turn-helix domain-containing protein n=1 Tax=Streptomyces sp. NBC_00989 TaxID=2903705 RepID=UPI003867EBD6|nr:helix-turn-helix domain-containing protein [Streptomyces sp. NBC_00989]
MLRSARKRAGMTQGQLAEISTVSIRAIRDLELDRTGSPRLQTVRLLADALRLNGARRAELEAVAGPTVVRSLHDDLPAPPAPLSPPLAREEETSSLIALLRSTGHRLVRVVGAPGVGKTTLVQNVASELHRNRLVPVLFLERPEALPGTGPHGSARRLLSRVADVVGCAPTVDEVAGSLAADEVLLVVDDRDLDERDHQDLRGLLRLCRTLRVLMESCDAAPVRVGEITFTLFPLDVPEWDPRACDAAALDSPVTRYMLSRCALLYPAEVSSPETVAAIAGVCWLLDGIPSALESAASWLLIYEPTELLRMAQASPARLVMPPSRTDAPLVVWMRDALTSLPPSQLDALRRLVDARPWTVSDAVTLLAGSVTDTESAVHALRARGLVRRVASAHGNGQRFVVLNLVRHLVHSEFGASSPACGVPVAWAGLRDVQPLTS